VTGFWPQPDKPRAIPREERRRIAAVSKRDSTALTLEADRLAKDELIRRVGGLHCQACGAKQGRGPIDRAHGFGKKAKPGLRWDRRNLVLLDRHCHRAFGRTHKTWLTFLEGLIGSAAFLALVETGRKRRRPLEEIVSGLKNGKFSNENVGEGRA